MPIHARTSRPAFTLIDVLVTISVMMVVAAIAIPAMSRGTQVNISGATTMIMSDLEFTQSLSLANPSNPALIRFDTASSAYWIARADNPDTPITRPGSNDEPYRVVLGQGMASAFAGITLDTSQLTDDTVVFDSYGRTLDSADLTITLATPAGQQKSIVISASTGFVTIL
ncbi:MAG: pilus assembly FimT family protein [Planctomycetota bacterium]|jgi:Tfp pilus assembly protein FimT